MDFKRLSETYFAATPEERTLSSIEYKSLSGEKILTGVTAHQTTFTVRGDGELEYFRRGDFGESGEVLSGVWQAQCQPSDLEEVWNILGDLGPDSFPERVADPGDTITALTGFLPNCMESLSWGPRNHSIPAPGNDFVVALAPLIKRTLDGKCLWAVSMTFIGLTQTSKGLEIRLSVNNPGIQPIGLSVSNLEGFGGFTLRYAADRNSKPGVPSLPLEWAWTKLHVTGMKSELLYILEPGQPLVITLQAELLLEPQLNYVGNVKYQQLGYLDKLIGIPILSGVSYTENFDFQS